MTVSYKQSQKAWQLSQRGFSVSEVAERLDTSDDRASQLIAYYQRSQPGSKVQLWWHGLTPSNRIQLEEVGLNSREAVEAAYHEGAFTEGHPKYLKGFSERHRKAIHTWLNQPEKEVVARPDSQTLTLCMSSERYQELESLCSNYDMEPEELVSQLIKREAKRCS
jgi:hypothetical protein